MKSAKLALKYLFISFLIICSFQCKKSSDNDNNKPNNNLLEMFNNFRDTSLIYLKLSEILKDNVFFADYDNYSNADSKLIIALSTKKQKIAEYGLKFSVLTIDSNNLVIKTQTDYFDGIKDMSEYGKTEIPGITKRFIYFDSKNSFIGSGGGEVYIYLFEPNSGEVFSLTTYFEKNQEMNEFSQNLQKQEYSALKDWMLNRVINSLSDANPQHFKSVYK